MKFEDRLNDEIIQFLYDEYAPYLPAKPTYHEQSRTDRVRRSLSWLERAIRASPEDTPTRFLELWIALNSLTAVADTSRYQSQESRMISDTS